MSLRDYDDWTFDMSPEDQEEAQRAMEQLCTLLRPVFEELFPKDGTPPDPEKIAPWKPVIDQFMELRHRIEGTYLLLQARCTNHALDYYMGVKMHAERGDPEAARILADLEPKFRAAMEAGELGAVIGHKND